MTYRNHSDLAPPGTGCLGILLTNLGTPDSPTTADVRRYLAEFLSDPRVVEFPRLLWKIILHGVILRIRPKRSAESYRTVWTESGSPLLDISRQQADKLQAALNERFGSKVKVVLAMRYGNPSIAQGLEVLRCENAERILILPLYPQYSATTTASTFDAVTTELQHWRRLPELRFINRYGHEADYIQVLADSIQRFREQHGAAEKLLFSFHGIPEDYAAAGDPYPSECRFTAEQVAKRLQLEDSQWQLSFQSRFGKKEWIKPYTDQTLISWGKAKIQHVQVVSPGFSADCLETLEEIAVENRGYFQKAGGGVYEYIPALNAQPDHIEMLAGIVEKHTQGWPESTTGKI
ncbi:ferrochelatase [endosymbiont of Lamellibrachia barhami]|uniref:ferrochelatase n=1 Tax=endosymbiont of Lamellibrachia barhami TaxID=205975 RepID=UPI0015A8BDD1|nr:ferrochelatase [endosymbiont of Lamellibrachia barhami]